MDDKQFILQQRFIIRPSTNAITDTLLQKEVKVEPRLIKLLCVLAKHQGQLVKREQLISEIWNDYGGGEAGLNHGISTLRKLLQDTSKNLIETIPTKGYILHAGVEEPQTISQQVFPAPKRFPVRSVVSASLLLLAAITFYFLWQTGTADKNKKGTSFSGELRVPFTEVNRKTAETSLNTIIAHDKDSTEYKLKIIGDGRPEFYINGRLLSPDEMEKHLELINNLKKQLRERNQ